MSAVSLLEEKGNAAGGSTVPPLRYLCARVLSPILMDQPRPLATLPHLVAQLLAHPPSLLSEESDALPAAVKHFAALHLLHPPAASGGGGGGDGSQHAFMSDVGVGGNSRGTGAVSGWSHEDDAEDQAAAGTGSPPRSDPPGAADSITDPVAPPLYQSILDEARACGIDVPVANHRTTRRAASLQARVGSQPYRPERDVMRLIAGIGRCAVVDLTGDHLEWDHSGAAHAVQQIGWPGLTHLAVRGRFTQRNRREAWRHGQRDQVVGTCANAMELVRALAFGGAADSLETLWVKDTTVSRVSGTVMERLLTRLNSLAGADPADPNARGLGRNLDFDGDDDDDDDGDGDGVVGGIGGPRADGAIGDNVSGVTPSSDASSSLGEYDEYTEYGEYGDYADDYASWHSAGSVPVGRPPAAADGTPHGRDRVPSNYSDASASSAYRPTRGSTDGSFSGGGASGGGGGGGGASGGDRRNSGAVGGPGVDDIASAQPQQQQQQPQPQQQQQQQPHHRHLQRQHQHSRTPASSGYYMTAAEAEQLYERRMLVPPKAREFLLLLHHLPSLRWLNGEEITDAVRADAERRFRFLFEVCPYESQLWAHVAHPIHHAGRDRRNSGKGTGTDSGMGGASEMVNISMAERKIIGDSKDTTSSKDTTNTGSRGGIVDGAVLPRPRPRAKKVCRGHPGAVRSVMSRTSGPTAVGPAWRSPLSTALARRRNISASLFDARLPHGQKVLFWSEFYVRQFEYNPRVPGMIAVGTGSGAIVVADTVQARVHAVRASSQRQSMVLGLGWLNVNPEKLLVGHDNGTLKLYDIGIIREGGGPADGSNDEPETVVNFERFPSLTNVHPNCTDTRFAVSGYQKRIGLYSLETGQRTAYLEDAHDKHINVLKFAHHHPDLLVSSSFDCTVKMWDMRAPSSAVFTCRSASSNVMVCFSDDDRFLLASGVDNDVRQYLASDGELCLRYAIPRLHSSQNYTRSYYMDGGDYIVSGSCQEPFVRVCSSRTGKILTEVDVSTHPAAAGEDMSDTYIQSLRGNPNKPLSCTVLAVSNGASTYNVLDIDFLQRSDAGAVGFRAV